ncbi:DUF3017 domain-containing protein [Pseudonocardiaceae bacterium YIM PH 21723]|nr:DUF3017 domain-containing protein [Pseudonocardiaceae bacterium YIM PH 21723]
MMTRDDSRIPDHLAFGLVMLTMFIGFIRIIQFYWREGSILVGGALLLAALLRALLSDEKAGLLTIRSRTIDVLCYTGLAFLIILVAITITGYRGPMA